MAKINQDKVANNIKKLTGVSDAKAKKSAAKFMRKRKNKGGKKRKKR